MVFIAIVEVNLLEEPRLYFEKSEYIKNHGAEIEILFMGNSTMGSAIIPDMVHPNSYNLALPVEHPTRSLELAVHLSTCLPNLDTVVLGLNYVSLLTKDHVANLNGIHYERFFELEGDSKTEKMFVSMSERPSRIFEMLGDVYPSITIDPNASKMIQKYGKGHYYSSKEYDDIKEVLKARYKIFKALTDTSHLSTNIIKLKQFVKTLNEKGIRVVFVRFPTPEIDVNFQDETLIDLQNQAIDEIIVECIACDYLDYGSTDGFASTDLYTDAFHFSSKGALKISDRIKDDLIGDL
jgi:hypothetical protein